jgi:hypothetical protein
MEWLNRLFKKPVYPKPVEVQTEYAFSLEGVDYFCCSDFINMPIKRAEKAMVFYEELKANIDYEYLDWFTQEVSLCLGGGKGNIDIGKVAILNNLLKERLNLAPDPQLLLKLASVVFFDANENINDFDFKYNEVKREAFKRAGVDVFFCTMPTHRLIPHIDTSKLDSTVMREAVLATAAKSLQFMDALSANGSTKDWTETSRKSLESAREQALELLRSQGLDYMNIISLLNKSTNGSPSNKNTV